MSSLVYFPLDEFLSKGHLNEEGFYFLQIRHELMIQTTIFSHEGNFFFTNRDDEMRFKLRWANVPAE